MSVQSTYQSIRRHPVAGPVVRWVAENSAIVALVAIVVIATILAGDNFMSQTNIINILRTVSIIGIISLGMTLIIISGGIDLSVGSALVLMGAGGIWVLDGLTASSSPFSRHSPAALPLAPSTGPSSPGGVSLRSSPPSESWQPAALSPCTS